MEIEPVEHPPASSSWDDRVEVRLTIQDGHVDADVDPVAIRHGQTVRWVVQGEDAGRVTLRFEERAADVGEAGVRLADAGLGPFAADGRPAPDVLERSGAGGFTLHLLYRVLVGGRDLRWPPHPVTGRPRNGGGIDVEVPPPGG